MKNLSTRRAVATGLRLLMQNPVAVLAWGLVTFASMAFSFWLRLAQNPVASALAIAVIVSTLAIVQSAIVRSIERPDERSRFYFQISESERRIIWQVCILSLIWWAFIFVSVGIVSTIIAPGSPLQFSGRAGVVLAVLSVFAVGLFLFARLSLAIPIAFSPDSFGGVDTWALTKGRSLPILIAMSPSLMTGVVAFFVAFPAWADFQRYYNAGELQIALLYGLLAATFLVLQMIMFTASSASVSAQIRSPT
jgi:hypothetical protein